jgi:uncharacterized protein YodC (DUF2158 family)
VYGMTVKEFRNSGQVCCAWFILLELEAQFK